MKTFLKFTVLSALLLVLAAGLSSCGKEEITTSQFGMYIETFPAVVDTMRLRINIVDEHTLFVIYSEWMGYSGIFHPETHDEFRYRMLRNNRIELTPMFLEGPDHTTIHHFRWINNRKFEIGLIPSFYYVFERK